MRLWQIQVWPGSWEPPSPGPGLRAPFEEDPALGGQTRENTHRGVPEPALGARRGQRPWACRAPFTKMQRPFS